MSFLRDQRHLFFLIVVIVACASVYYIVNIHFMVAENIVRHVNRIILRNQEFIHGEPYLIRTPKCRISTYHYFSKKFYFKHLPYEPCPRGDIFSQIVYENGSAYLVLTAKNQLIEKYLLNGNISCCASLISEDTLKNSGCASFKGNISISYPDIKVMCFGKGQRNVYENVHALIKPTLIPPNLPEASQSVIYKNVTESEKPYSILILGISNISKLDVMRLMPRTDLFFETLNFNTLRGYSKISSDMTTNLLALLSGENEWDPLDSPDLLFSRVKRHNYVTAYGEDISTFSLRSLNSSSIDLNLEHYMASARRLHTNLVECYGVEYGGQRILNMARDFTIQLKNVPTFGLFWIHTFTDESIHFISSMDRKMVAFLQSIIDHLDNTFLFILSNQGFVMPNMQNTDEGWLEERLPFFRLHVPRKFRKKYPRKDFYLRMNALKLTTPYDIYMTLQDILKTSHKNFAMKNSTVGRSLFEKPNRNRTCRDAGISKELCPCHTMNFLDTDATQVLNASTQVVKKLNEFIATFPERHRCELYSLRKIVVAGRVDESENAAYVNERKVMLYLKLELNPNTKLEGRIPLDFMRLDFAGLYYFTKLSFRRPKHCVADRTLRKICHCLFTK